MKIEFERLNNDCVACTFYGGGQMAVVEDEYTPEKRGNSLDFLGNLATRALEKATEQERSKMAEKIYKDILNESKHDITKWISTPQRSTNYWQQGLLPKQNPYIVGGVKAKVERMQPKIEKVIFNSPATIVFWSDGDKTVVKSNNEAFDPEKGLAMAIAKKFLGNKGNYFDTFKKYIK